MPPVVVDVYSDFACPWCYVGDAELKLALRQFASPVTVRFHPYVIDAATADQGEEYLAYNRRRWGGDGWTYSLRERGQQVGCPFAQWVTWPNTWRAHRLMEWCGKRQPAQQGALKDAIFQAVYERGSNISLESTLGEIAASIGLDASALLASNEGLKEVKADDQYAKRTLGITGVPHFVVHSSENGTGEQSIQLAGAVSANKLLAAMTKFSKP